MRGLILALSLAASAYATTITVSANCYVSDRVTGNVIIHTTGSTESGCVAQAPGNADIVFAKTYGAWDQFEWTPRPGRPLYSLGIRIGIDISAHSVWHLYDLWADITVHVDGYKLTGLWDLHNDIRGEGAWNYTSDGGLMLMTWPGMELEDAWIDAIGVFAEPILADPLPTETPEPGTLTTVVCGMLSLAPLFRKLPWRNRPYPRPVQ